MSALSDFRFCRPSSASEAVALRLEHPASRFIAGGTDLLPNMRHGLVGADVLIDLGNIGEMSGVQEADGALRIGAGTTLAALAAHPTVQARFPALAQAALGVAGPTHRTAATVGGNLCLDTRCRYYNQSATWREGNQFCMKLAGDVCRVATKSERCYAAFSGDVAPALLVLDAQLDILGAQGLRSVPIGAFYRDDGQHYLGLAPDELLLAVRVPLHGNLHSAYEKVRIRDAIDFPLTGVAVALRRSADRGNSCIGHLAIACTGVSSRPERVEGLEALAGQALDDAAFALIEKQIKRGIQAMETTIVSVPYRRRVTPVLARRMIERLWQAAEASV